MRAALAVSGGLDSAVLLAQYAAAGDDVLAVSVNYGQRNADRELAAASWLTDHYRARHVSLDLRALGRHLGGSALTDPAVPMPEGHYADPAQADTIVPNRNAILGSILVGVALAAGAEVVALGMHATDNAVYPDCRPAFVDAFADLVAVANDGLNPPRVVAPLLILSKAEVVRHGARLGVPFARTWSCYRGDLQHCGRCGACVERREAFTLAGVPDPTQYAGGFRTTGRAGR